jgi:hypothetical protein
METDVCQDDGGNKMIPIDEQIEYMQSIVATSMLPTHMPKAILASLERLKKIDAVQVPDEPMHYDCKDDNGFVASEDYDTLRDLLKRIVMEELK